MAGNPGHQYRTLEAWKIAQATLPDSLRRRARPFVRGCPALRARLQLTPAGRLPAATPRRGWATAAPIAFVETSFWAAAVVFVS